MITGPDSPALEATLRIPEAARDGAALIVLMHGRGSDRDDLAPLAGSFPDDAVLAFPAGPFAGAPWGYGPGRAWYRFLGGATPEPESFERGQRALAGWLDALRASLPVRTGQLIVGGFSQGGTSAIGYALRNPGTVHGVLNWSGFVPEHPSVEARRDNCAGLRVFWGHGTADGNVPHTLAVTGRATLGSAGAMVTAFDHSSGHTITRNELAETERWIAATLESAAGTR
jgi:phospholipase/carboxylesterase